MYPNEHKKGGSGIIQSRSSQKLSPALVVLNGTSHVLHAFRVFVLCYKCYCTCTVGREQHDFSVCTKHFLQYFIQA